MPGDYRDRLEAWKVRSPVVKFNAALSALPDWTAAPGETLARPREDRRHARPRCRPARVRGVRGGEPSVGFGEIYLQTGYDPTPAPEGIHLISVFGQYAPYELAEGDWDSRREEVARQFIDLIGTFAPASRTCLEHHEVLGPPDIEARSA